MTATDTFRVLGIVGSITSPSRGRTLVEYGLGRLAAGGAATDLLDLNDLPADALLGRRRDPALAEAFAAVAAARIILLGTPTYRATYSGLLKTFFDLLPREALAGKAVGAIATGAGDGHALMVDHGIRPLIASLGGLGAAGCLYVGDADYPSSAGTAIPEAVAARVDRLAEELRALAHAPAAAAQVSCNSVAGAEAGGVP